MARIGGLACGACVLLVAGCGPDHAGTGPVPGDSVRVSLGLYSGREDPRWALPPQQAAALDARIDALPTANGTPPRGGLGYHGFYITETVNGQVQPTQVAYRGAIGPDSDQPHSYRVDPARSIERYLLHTGRSHLTPAERAAVEEALANP